MKYRLLNSTDELIKVKISRIEIRSSEKSKSIWGKPFEDSGTKRGHLGSKEKQGTLEIGLAFC